MNVKKSRQTHTRHPSEREKGFLVAGEGESPARIRHCVVCEQHRGEVIEQRSTGEGLLRKLLVGELSLGLRSSYVGMAPKPAPFLL